MAVVSLLGAVALGCRQGAPPTRPEESFDPYCAATLEVAGRAPALPSTAPLVGQSRARGDEVELVRLANRTCPFGWLAVRASGDAVLARRVLARCADAEAVLALVCAAAGRLDDGDSEAIVAWAERHPVARADDGPAIAHAHALLGAIEGAEAARQALARVSYPTR